MSKPTTRLRLTLLLMSLVLLGLIVVALSIGPVPVSVGRVAELLLGIQAQDPHDLAATIIWRIRLPRVLLAVLVGAALAQSGAVMQGFFQNPMADPYIIGVSAGAALGATLASYLGLDIWVFGISGMGVGAFVGALLVTGLVYTVSMRSGRLPVTMVLLTGVALGSLASAATSFLVISSGRDLPEILFWLMGGLDLVVLAVAILFFPELQALCFDEEYARLRGLPVQRLSLMLHLLTALTVVLLVSIVGIVLVIALLTLPVAIAGRFGKSLKFMMILGALLSMLFTSAGLALSFSPDLPAGATTILLAAFVYFLVRLIPRGLWEARNLRRNSHVEKS